MSLYSIAVFRKEVGMFDVEPGSNYDSAYFEFNYLIGLIKTDCFSRADNLADLTFPFI